MKKNTKILLFSYFLVLTLLVGTISSVVFAEEDPGQPDTFGTTDTENILADKTETDFTITESAANDSMLLYLPDVTSEMSSASFWIQKEANPDQILADPAMIEAVNQAILNGEGTNMYDLKTWPETYNGITLNDSLVSSGQADAEYFWNVGVRFKEDGTKYASKEEAMEQLFQPLINNGIDPDAQEEMSVKYAVCTTRTTLRPYATDHPLYDDPTDPDFDYLYLSAIRVNEPLILRAKSADGRFYQAVSSSTSGWVPAEDLAICADRQEWLDAWDFPSDKTLVVYDDKIITEDSNYAPETANRLLTMGTCLELADPEDCEGLIINRRAYNNHVVYLPVRQEDGSYKKVLSLIGENRKVSIGYLPVTISNIVSVAMNQLGDTYGWGGMLLSEDCSGYVRDVYKCFGLDLARNTTWQTNQPVYKFDLANMDLDAKAALIKDLPPGSILIFRGHEMLYLGEDNGKLYVISSVSDVVIEGSAKRIRGGVINTLDMLRGNGNTWLKEIHTAEVPYYPEGYNPPVTEPADYREVEAALEKAASLNPICYTEKSFVAVDAAVDAVVWDKTIEEQAEVDAMAATINEAIDALVAYNGWRLVDGNYYYIKNGVIYTGWLKYGDHWYYMNADGIMQTGWVQVGGTWYYMDASGAMMTGWLAYNGQWYYMNSSGAMVTGWVQVGGTWYYMDASGAMMTGWVRDNNQWYYMNSSGAMTTGWLAYNSQWYYMKRSGAMAASEWVPGYYWISANGVWTYEPKGAWKQNSVGKWFEDASGWYAKNETIIIDEAPRSFDAAGYLIEE